MKLSSKILINEIGVNPQGVSRIELIVETVGGIADGVPAVFYKVYGGAGKEISSYHIVCRGYWGPGKWKARQVASEVWTYYRSRGFKVSISDQLG